MSGLTSEQYSGLSSQPQINGQLLRVAISAACMARGLSAEEAVDVYGLLAPQEIPTGIEAVYEQLERAIETVKDRRPRFCRTCSRILPSGETDQCEKCRSAR